MQKRFIKKTIHTETVVPDVTDQALDTLSYVVNSTESTINQTVAPVREGLSKRFPSLFLLAVTFGFTATVVGIEHILIQYEFLQKYPSVILAIGIFILVLTGTTYKKLG